MKKLQKEILQLLIQDLNKYYTSQELLTLLDVNSLRTVQSNIKELVDEKRVQIKGERSSTKYALSNSYYNDLKEKLYIYQNQTLVGYLGYDYESYYFVYDTQYLLNANNQVRFEMDFSLKTFIQNECFVDFEETLPEGIDKKILIEKTGNATEFFLLKNNNYSSNDLIFIDTKLTFDDEFSSQSFLSNKDQILGCNIFPNVLEQRIALSDTVLFPSNYEDQEEKFKSVRTISLSGYQHKLQVIITEDEIREPIYGDVVEYFVKPYHPQKADPKSSYYFPHIAINEHLHLTFAKNELGFDVPESAIFKRDTDAEYHYAVKYFDRFQNYKFQRKEFSTYMGLNSERKYNTSSEKLFAKANDVLLSKNDKETFLKYYFYSFLIKHEDMHTKNLSIIYDKGKTFMSPLYDVATTGVYEGMSGYESHLPINGKQTNIRFNDFVQLAAKLDISKQEFKAIAKDITMLYIEKMPEYIDKVSNLENTDFYLKSKPNANGKAQKVIGQTSLDRILFDNYAKRIQTLDKNGWFAQLGIDLQEYETRFLHIKKATI